MRSWPRRRIRDPRLLAHISGVLAGAGRGRRGDGGRECRLPTTVPVILDENNKVKEIKNLRQVLQEVTENP